MLYLQRVHCLKTYLETYGYGVPQRWPARAAHHLLQGKSARPCARLSLTPSRPTLYSNLISDMRSFSQVTRFSNYETAYPILTRR